MVFSDSSRACPSVCVVHGGGTGSGSPGCVRGVCAFVRGSVG